MKFSLNLTPRAIAPYTPIFFWLALTAFILAAFFNTVDLKPKIDEAFFFSSNDPQFKADKTISTIFPQPAQFVIGVKGDIFSAQYAEGIKNFSDELALLPEVFGVQSLSRGPEDLKDAFESPLWRRVLISQDGESSFISVFIKDVPVEEIARKIESVRDRFDAPDFQVMISGAPYIVELISRKLLRDLQIFTLAAFFVFGLVLFLIFRSLAILLGTLLSCINASCATLMISHLLHIPIGPLTANLSTIVFVLTLSPIVFLTFNWEHLAQSDQVKGFGSVWEAIKITIFPSFWSMATTLLGFLSLLFVQATPMRQLGISGAIGTFVAFASAYTIYPWFLEWASRSAPNIGVAEHIQFKLRQFFSKKHSLIAVSLLVFASVLFLGLSKLNMDPDMLSYFKKGSELRDGLEYIDRNGGISPLKLVVVDQEQAPFNTGDSYVKLWRLHEALEKDPAVGNVVSLPLILAEAKRSPLTLVMTTEWLLKLMEGPKFGEIAKYFVTEDRKMAFFLLRMKEQGRQISRLEVIRRVENIVQNQGFGPVLVGGVYVLQGKLSELLSSSLVSGVMLLLSTFFVMGWVLTRSLKISGALLASLTAIPVCVLGIIGYVKMPLDVISAPAANLAIGMGVDAMIYLSVFVRRHSKEEPESWSTWSEVCSRLWQPIATSLVIICSGFGIFLLSAFPPT
ncbi:MAG: MMPL family transporter, partial [Candidatus Omnitrophica bacterium]|nr:MMPL family transporter [Candidatus Omnitrophota bacterium]